MTFAVHSNERGIIVLTLSGDNLEMVEPGRCTYQMPFTNQTSAVTSLLKELGHRLLGAVEYPMLVIGKAVLVAMFAGNHTGTTGTGERVGHKAVYKTYTIAGNTVEVWSLHMGFIVAGHHLCSMVICHDVQNIWTLLGMKKRDKRKEKTHSHPLP